MLFMTHEAHCSHQPEGRHGQDDDWPSKRQTSPNRACPGPWDLIPIEVFTFADPKTHALTRRSSFRRD